MENILVAGRIIGATRNRIEENRNESVLRVEIGEYSSHARNGEAISRSEIYVGSSRSRQLAVWSENSGSRIGQRILARVDFEFLDRPEVCFADD